MEEKLKLREVLLETELAWGPRALEGPVTGKPLRFHQWYFQELHQVIIRENSPPVLSLGNRESNHFEISSLTNACLQGQLYKNLVRNRGRAIRQPHPPAGRAKKLFWVSIEQGLGSIKNRKNNKSKNRDFTIKWYSISLSQYLITIPTRLQYKSRLQVREMPDHWFKEFLRKLKTRPKQNKQKTRGKGRLWYLQTIQTPPKH